MTGKPMNRAHIFRVATASVSALTLAACGQGGNADATSEANAASGNGGLFSNVSETINAAREMTQGMDLRQTMEGMVGGDGAAAALGAMPPEMRDAIQNMQAAGGASSQLNELITRIQNGEIDSENIVSEAARLDAEYQQERASTQALTESAGVMPDADQQGMLVGSLDGQPASWSFWAGQSDYWGTLGHAAVTITGWPEQTPEDVSHIAVSFELNNGRATIPQIAMENVDRGREYFGDESTGAQITLTRADMNNDILSIAGHVSATLYYSEDFGETLDHNRSRLVILDFDGVLDTNAH